MDGMKVNRICSNLNTMIYLIWGGCNWVAQLVATRWIIVPWKAAFYCWPRVHLQIDLGNEKKGKKCESHPGGTRHIYSSRTGGRISGTKHHYAIVSLTLAIIFLYNSWPWGGGHLPSHWQTRRDKCVDTDLHPCEEANPQTTPTLTLSAFSIYGFHLSQNWIQSTADGN